MRNAGLEETQAGIKIARRNINNLRYADDTTLMAESPAPRPSPQPILQGPRTPPLRCPRTWRVLVFMLLQVPVQVGLLPEAAVAQVALEGLLLVVDVPHSLKGNTEVPGTTSFKPLLPS